MNTKKLFGIVLVVAGVILLMIGLNATDSVADRMSNFFTGHFTDATTWYLIGGGAAIILGAVVVFPRGRRKLT